MATKNKTKQTWEKSPTEYFYDLWDNFKESSICVIGVWEREEMKEGTEKNIWTNNGPNFSKSDENYKPKRKKNAHLDFNSQIKQNKTFSQKQNLNKKLLPAYLH